MECHLWARKFGYYGGTIFGPGGGNVEWSDANKKFHNQVGIVGEHTRFKFPSPFFKLFLNTLFNMTKLFK